MEGRRMRKITVAVVPRASKRELVWISDSEAKVWVHSPPDKGKANAEVCALIAKVLGVKPSQVRVVTGATSTRKVVAIED